MARENSELRARIKQLEITLKGSFLSPLFFPAISAKKMLNPLHAFSTARDIPRQCQY